MKHTPGPWKIKGSRITGADHQEDTASDAYGVYSVVIDCQGAMGGSGDIEADKRLIAAAPEMYDIINDFCHNLGNVQSVRERMLDVLHKIEMDMH